MEKNLIKPNDGGRNEKKMFCKRKKKYIQIDITKYIQKLN